MCTLPAPFTIRLAEGDSLYRGGAKVMEVASPAGSKDGLVEDPLRVPCLTLDRDWDAFARAKCLSEATAKRWLSVLRSFEKHLGRSDLATMTPGDVEAWIMSKFDSSMSKKTVMGVYLPAIMNFVAWASEENRIDKIRFLNCGLR